MASPPAKQPETDRAGEPKGRARRSSSPPPPPPADGTAETRPARSSSYVSRSTSPAVAGSDRRATPFQYGFNIHGGLFPEASHAPQACV